jgi:hypothetical protein
MNSHNIKPGFFLNGGVPFVKGNITILGIPHVEKLGVHPGLTLEMIHQEWKDSCASQSVHHHFPEMMI